MTADYPLPRGVQNVGLWTRVILLEDRVEVRLAATYSRGRLAGLVIVGLVLFSFVAPELQKFAGGRLPAPWWFTFILLILGSLISLWRSRIPDKPLLTIYDDDDRTRSSGAAASEPDVTLSARNLQRLLVVPNTLSEEDDQAQVVQLYVVPDGAPILIYQSLSWLGKQKVYDLAETLSHRWRIPIENQTQPTEI